jgi:glyoxylase-like metal-dependent hydrolase (beta-lactamase superfamily II)
MTSLRFTLGSLNMHIIQDGTFWLDGGAMFGIVPKILWNKLNPADPENRIKLALNCLAIKHPDGVVLIDTGLGDSLKDRFIEIYRIERNHTFYHILAEHGIKPDEVKFVINTHLHFDHCGGNTIKEGGQWKPAFPNARYLVQELEWLDAVNSNERTQASYLKETFMPLEQAGCIERVSGEHEVVPGVKLIRTNGHTRGHQSVLVESMGEKAFYLGDLIPTTSHIKLPYTMGYDLYPMDLIATKKEILSRAAKENWLLVFEHDPVKQSGYVEERNGSFVMRANYQSTNKEHK